MPRHGLCSNAKSKRCWPAITCGIDLGGHSVSENCTCYWGWETHWTPTCGGTRLGHEPFITSPILLGWEDVDGDGIPEILDDTPYGRSDGR
jgi:hypothetical protein